MKKQIFLFLSILISLSVLQSKPQILQSDQIVFLNLNITDEKVSLIDFNMVTGNMKQKKKLTFIENHIYCKVSHEDGTILYETVFPNPSIVRSEYEDSQGNLQLKTVEIDTIDFSIKIPRFKTINNIEIFKIDNPLLKCKKLKKPNNLIGSFNIDVR